MDEVPSEAAARQIETMGTEQMKLSVVIPVYNEEESLPELYDRLNEVATATGWQYEYIFVDDGSTDRSVIVLRELREMDPWHVNVISFRRNYGKSAALETGFRAVDGDVVITMDADLQDDPGEIPNLVAKLNSGADLVSGWKKTRHDPISKTAPSKVFNTITSIISGIRLHDFNCGLKAYRREVVDSITLYGELHRFIPVLAAWEGFKVDEIEVRHARRKYGRSKYGARRFLNGFFDLVTVMFVTRRALNPLHFFGRIAIVLFALGMIPLLVFLIRWLGGSGLHIRPIMLVGFVFVIVALQIASIGLLAEMISSRSAKDSTYSFKEYHVRDLEGPPRLKSRNPL
jgi:glycosyltransferase involved in cell wall biosynthesis